MKFYRRSYGGEGAGGGGGGGARQLARNHNLTKTEI